MNGSRQHWDKVYSEKAPTEVSWYEPMPQISLELIRSCGISEDAAIIDIGGGDSFLAEFLISLGYTNVTVVDISSKAIARAKERMCEKADEVKWIVADVSNFEPERQYDLWHDRAAFHFLTAGQEKQAYLEKLKNAVKPGGYVIMGTFSERGPEKCSGLEVQRYSVNNLCQLFEKEFSMLNGKNVDHQTPSGKSQNFTFCSFQKKQ
ncbi:class I SAM-dependent methyltransferase [Salinimicrobium tongyeongense]|uniref:Class I SAM-dependent methyltransferase n=1 Tax=Salinimicrobium tongyeongense TaxID=2809707 RepID=A0ABY6NR16_9FLAO|nr:class I SAM-dependent methyltransferase [Salinimicrobium tongyeongense]UZH55360.1 class I SAM-dependent methyltransferase [Salinimicrobium tongyeongense]